LVVACLLAGSPSAFPRPIPPAEQPVPMKRPPADTNAARWHSIKVTPRADLPKIHFYDKLNPVWWVENSDEPVPPEWYKPDDRHRVMKWHFRNPFHNFDNYVIGVADKKFVRSGKYPERNSNRNGGWDFEVARRKLVLLPFLSYQRGGFNFYFGWRERGNFGIKLNYSKPPEKKPQTDDSQSKPAPWQADKKCLFSVAAEVTRL
jgi:hypothetical protein